MVRPMNQGEEMEIKDRWAFRSAMPLLDGDNILRRADEAGGVAIIIRRGEDTVCLMRREHARMIARLGIEEIVKTEIPDLCVKSCCMPEATLAGVYVPSAGQSKWWEWTTLRRDGRTVTPETMAFVLSAIRTAEQEQTVETTVEVW
jgi:formylmethanofuran dehydrogenase subunit B